MACWILSALLCWVGGSEDCTLVHFTASWSEPCQKIRPELYRLASEGWSLKTVDVDREPQLTQQFRIENLPTVVILCRDQEVDRLVGAAPYSQLVQRATRAAARNKSSAQRVASNTNSARETQPQPVVRGQSPTVGAFPMLTSMAVDTSRIPGNDSERALPAQPALSQEQAITRAARATVRIRVDEAKTTAYGTGTIIDVHGDEALVLTCGHLFRDMQPNSQLTLDLFPGTPQQVNLPSQLIDFKADNEDIGLISFRIPVAIEAVPISPRGNPQQIGAPVFSFGCDHGADPTRRDTVITRVNRYVGPDNIEIKGAPPLGRSGGGLFDSQGRLIGVCNGANLQDDEGVYAAADVVYEQLERLGMSSLFTQNAPATQLASAVRPSNPSQSVNAFDGSPTAAASQSWSSSPANEMSWPDQDATLPDSLTSNSPEKNSDASRTTASAQGGTKQLICILRNAAGQDKVITIDAPPVQLLQMIQSQSTN